MERNIWRQGRYGTPIPFIKTSCNRILVFGAVVTKYWFAYKILVSDLSLFLPLIIWLPFQLIPPPHRVRLVGDLTIKKDDSRNIHTHTPSIAYYIIYFGVSI